MGDLETPCGEPSKGQCISCCSLVGLLFPLVFIAELENRDAPPPEETNSFSRNDSNLGEYLVDRIEIYQRDISPVLREKYNIVCKFEPSCSEYARQAVIEHGPVKGSFMAATRIARCNPLSEGGYDPVPKKNC